MDKEDKYMALITEYANSDLTATRFCKDRGIPYRTFSRHCHDLNFDVRKRSFKRGGHPASRMQLMPHNSQTHGAYQWLTTRTRRCNKSCVWWSECDHAGKQEDCIVLDTYLSDVRQQILNQPGVDEYRDSLLIDRLLKCLGFCTLIEWWSFAKGAMVQGKDGWKLAPALSTSYLAYNNTIMRGLRELGMTPSAAKGIAAREHHSIVEQYNPEFRSDDDD